MSSEWIKTQIGSLGRIVTGKTPLTERSEYFGGNIPFLTPTDMVDGYKSVRTIRTLTDAGLTTVRNCLVPRGVAVSCIGWQMGKSVLVLEPTVTNQQIHTIVVDESRFDLHFVYYLLAGMRNRIFELGATATRTPIVNKTTFSEVTIFTPDIHAQKRLANFISTLDDRITLLRETNATLEAIAQALFKSWFVDFDPVRAKMEGRAPEGMDEATAALFPDGLEASELGGVPTGWQVARLGSVCSYLSRGLSPKYLEAGGILVLNQKCIRDFSVDYGKGRRHDPSQRKIDGKKVSVGDVLVNSTGVGTLGRVAQVLLLPESAIVDSHVTVVRAGPNLTWPYLGQFMARKQPEIEAMGEGSTGQTELSRTKLAGMPIMVPTAPILSAFDEVVVPLKRRIAINDSKVQTLAALRDTLLPRLISGQLRLSEIAAVSECTAA